MDWFSMPALAVVSFCQLNNIPHETRQISIMKMQHLSKEYAKVNPQHKIPSIQEIDSKTGEVLLTLSESHTIIRYLARTRDCPEHWYPRKDLRKQAIIDECLDRHHTWLRQGSTWLVLKKCFSAKLFKREASKNELNFHEVMLSKSLRQMENQLKN